MVEVIAPATLSEGYQFEAQLGERTIQVTVPQGGVEGGQKFMVPLQESPQASILSHKVNIPVGHWRDGLCNCCAYGPCHNHFIMACLCPLVAAGQIISRLKFTIWGKPGTTAETAGAFQTIVAMTAAYFLIVISIAVICAPFDPDYPPPFVVVLLIVKSFMGYAFLLYSIIVLWNLRSYIRNKYAIPESCNTGCDDLLCAVCCSHCAVAQMLRHTTDYDTYNASCCSETGVPPHVPSIV